MIPKLKEIENLNGKIYIKQIQYVLKSVPQERDDNLEQTVPENEKGGSFPKFFETTTMLYSQVINDISKNKTTDRLTVIPEMYWGIDLMLLII